MIEKRTLLVLCSRLRKIYDKRKSGKGACARFTINVSLVGESVQDLR